MQKKFRYFTLFINPMPFNTEITSFDMFADASDNTFGSYDNPYSYNKQKYKKDKHFSKFFKKRKKSRK